LVIDAFGGDAIPVHLLTREVIAKYYYVLKDKGIILFHVSNRYVALENVIARSALELGAYVGIGRIPGKKNYSLTSIWVAVTWDKENFKRFPSFNLRPVQLADVQNIRGWTDTYSHLLPYLRLQVILDVKKFRFFRCD
jgi:hypothetical protein